MDAGSRLEAVGTYAVGDVCEVTWGLPNIYVYLLLCRNLDGIKNEN